MGENVAEAFDGLRLRLRHPLLGFVSLLAGDECQVLALGDDDLGLAVARLDLAVHAHSPAAVALVEVTRREDVEARGLDDGGEAVEARLECEQARGRRAVDAEHPPLDRGLLADVLRRLVPGDRRLRLCHRTEHDSEHEKGAAPSHAASSP